ncbi:MAG: hypothetical protein AB8I52_03555 [Candidatus Promineifilaceae bacterium]
MNINRRAIIFLFFLLLLPAGCRSNEEPRAAAEPGEMGSALEMAVAGTLQPQPTTMSDQGGAVNATLEAAGVIETRPPQPTATPGFLSQTVDEFTYATELEGVNFLGLSAEDWINLGISLSIVILGYLIGRWLIRILRHYAVPLLREEKSKDRLQKAAPNLVWVIVMVALNLATTRLTFLTPAIKTGLQNIYYITGIFFLARITWYLIDIADLETRAYLRESNREENLSPAIVLSVRLLRVLGIIVAVSLILSHFGINMTAFAALLGIGGLAFSLSPRGTPLKRLSPGSLFWSTNLFAWATALKSARPTPGGTSSISACARRASAPATAAW